jgi:hypothetical protein
MRCDHIVLQCKYKLFFGGAASHPREVRNLDATQTFGRQQALQLLRHLSRGARAIRAEFSTTSSTPLEHIGDTRLDIIAVPM